MEADTLRFQDSVRKVAALTHDLKHVCILIDVLVSEVRHSAAGCCTAVQSTELRT